MRQITKKLDAIHKRLSEGGELTHEDYDLICNSFADDIPYGTLKGRTGCVGEWFLEQYQPVNEYIVEEAANGASDGS